jgi:hypothetical protein
MRKGHSMINSVRLRIHRDPDSLAHPVQPVSSKESDLAAVPRPCAAIAQSLLPTMIDMSPNLVYSIALGNALSWPRSACAAAIPLRTAPSIVAGQPVRVHAPASTRPGAAVAVTGRRAS